MFTNKKKLNDDLSMILQYIDNQSSIIDIKEFTRWLIDYDLLKCYSFYFLLIGDYINYHNNNCVVEIKLENKNEFNDLGW